MNYKKLFWGLCFIILSIGTYYLVLKYKQSGQHIDASFSNRIKDNKQFPKNIEGDCFGGTDILSAKVIRETSASLLLRVTYCNNLKTDKAVLALKADQYPLLGWAYTPGGTVVGHGEGYVRLKISNLNKPVTVSNYKILIYANNARSEIISYPFKYEKIWCNNKECG